MYEAQVAAQRVSERREALVALAERRRWRLMVRRSQRVEEG
jgi:hypothetical protein